MVYDTYDMMLGATTLDHLRISLTAVGLAFIPAFPLGYLASRWDFLYHGVSVLMRFVWSIPLFGALGLVLSLSPRHPELGFGIFLVFCALLPLCAFLARGIRHIDTTALEACRAMGFGDSKLFFMLKLPGVLPSLLEGLRIASLLTVSLTAVAGAFDINGLGFMIITAVHEDRLDKSLSGSLALCAMALVINYSFKLAIWRFSRHEKRPLEESTPLLG